MRGHASSGGPLEFPRGGLGIIGTLGIVLLTVLIGYLATLDALLLEVHFSPTGTNLLALAILVALGVTVLKYPRLALISLVVFIFLNLSQLLVRFHSLPSVLQFAILPVAATAWIHRDPRIGMARLGNSLTVSLFGYTLIVFFSTIRASDQLLADQRCLMLSKALALHCLVVLLARDRRELKWALWAVFGAAALLAGLGVWQVLTGQYGWEWGGLARVKYAQIYDTTFEPRVAGPLGDPNFFAQILLLALPLGLFASPRKAGRLKRVVICASAMLIGAGIIFSYSRGGALSLGVVLVLWVALHRHDWSKLILGIAVLLVLLLLVPGGFKRRMTTIPQILPGSGGVLHPDSSFEKRKLLARAGWRLFETHFILGVGAGNFTTHFDKFADEVGSAARDYDDPAQLHYPHNLYLEIGTETGVPGLMAFSIVLAATFFQLSGARKRLLKAGDQETADLARAMQVSCVGFLVSSIFLHLQYPRYFWLILALVAALSNVAQEKDARE